MTEQQRKNLNEVRLQLIDDSIRANVRAVLASMEHYGHRPLIAKDVWRDPKVQLQMVKRGVSKLKWGFHCAVTKDGRSGSLAADIVDAEKAWNASRGFWLRLGYCALAQGLNWGGYFGLNPKLKIRLRELVDSLNEKGSASNFNDDVKVGWDPAHVETARVTVAEARAGKR